MIITNGGGIFSQFFHSLIQDSINYKFNISNHYLLNCLCENFKDPKYLKSLGTDITRIHNDISINGYDYIFDQKSKDKKTILYSKPQSAYNHKNNLSKSINLTAYKKNYDSLKVSQKLQKKFDQIDKISENVEIGLHIRITTMNHWSKFSKIDINDYFKISDKIFEDYSPKKVIVASDNKPSLDKFIDRYKDIEVIVNNGVERFMFSNESNQYYQDIEINKMFTEEYWISAFMEAYILSKPNIIIKRESNLNNMAMVMKGSPQKEIFLENVI